MTVALYRMTVHCSACGLDWSTFVSAAALDESEGRRLINAECDTHTAVCPARNACTDCDQAPCACPDDRCTCGHPECGAC